MKQIDCQSVFIRPKRRLALPAVYLVTIGIFSLLLYVKVAVTRIVTSIVDCLTLFTI